MKQLEHQHRKSRKREHSRSVSRSKEKRKIRQSPSPVERKKRSKHRSKRKKKKKSKNGSSSSSSSTSSSSPDSDSSGSDADSLRKSPERFNIISPDEINKYNLTQGLADYANQYSSQYFPEKEIKEKILIIKPVPENIHPIKTLDEFVRDAMKKKNPHDLMWDGVLEKVSKSIRDVMGPLSQTWLTLDQAFKSTTETVSVDLEKITENIEQAVLLLGQIYQCYNIP